ncbi:hypothetical protein Daesc_009869 [Daldinia eschscholtzii]|uniref:BTB domain-containing protein n=1 Tax=Daldinia eschscholtzii TaxID=292717 RepID=A0AAX6M6H0_9PEZI
MSSISQDHLSSETMLRESGEAKAFNGQFMEATTGELTLQDQVPSNVDQVVRYLYTGQVSKDFVEEDPCQLFKLADFFQIASLVKEIVSITNTKLNGMADRLRNMPQPDTELRSIFSDEEVDYLFRVIETSYEEVPVPPTDFSQP